MTALQEIDLTAQSTSAIAEELRALASANASDRLTLLLDQLVDHAEEAVHADPVHADPAAVALQRDRLDRIARRLADAAHLPLVGFALGYLKRADRDLDRARTRMLGQIAERRRAEEARGVRDRILAALERPRRPRDIAADIGVDPSQVSREIRLLLKQRRVARVAPPSDAGDDGRAHWYARAASAAKAHARAGVAI